MIDVDDVIKDCPSCGHAALGGIAKLYQVITADSAKLVQWVIYCQHCRRISKMTSTCIDDL